MTREPLMLSDTAMVLLREYVQIDRDEKILFAVLFPEDRSAKLPADGREIRALSLHRTQLKTEILRDIWLTWAYPDIKLVRYLNAHIVLNDRLLDLCEMTFLPPDNGQTRVTRYPHVDATLMNALVWAYRQAQISDTQDPAEGAL